MHRRRPHPTPTASPRLVPPIAAAGALAALVLAGVPAPARPDAPRPGVDGMLEPHTACLLVDYYQSFLSDQDLDAFRRDVSARYTEGSLCRLLRSGPSQARRAAVLALGLIGTFGSNRAVAEALRDPDPAVRNLAQNALWGIWGRADTPENIQALEEVRDQIGRGLYPEAIARASALIARAPRFAEAYNQRALAYYLMGRFDASAADCRRTLERNPYHIGALAGLAKCYLSLGDPARALATFRRAARLQPYDEDLRATIRAIEAAES